MEIMTPSHVFRAANTNDNTFKTGEVYEYLRFRGLPVLTGGVQKVCEHFNTLASEGYDLRAADGTMYVEALKALNVLPNYFEVGRAEITDEDSLDEKGDMRTSSIAVFKLKAHGEEKIVAAESFKGAVDATIMAGTIIFSDVFPNAAPLEFRGYKLEILGNAYGSDANTRTSIVFSSVVRGVLQEHTFQGVHPNLLRGARMALYDAKRLFLYKQRISVPA